MDIIIKERGHGKTSDLIRMSAANNIPIVCRETRYVKEMIKEMGYEIGKDIPDVISLRDFVKPHYCQTLKYDQVYIDELGFFFEYAYGVKMAGCTIDIEDVTKRDMGR